MNNIKPKAVTQAENNNFYENADVSLNYKIPEFRAPKSGYAFFPSNQAQRLDLSSLVFWDIETIRAGETFQNDRDDLETHSLNVDNVKQIACLIPSEFLTKKSEILLADCRRVEEIEIHGVMFTSAIVDCDTPFNTARHFVQLRHSLSKNLAGVTFNGHRFDAAIFTQVFQKQEDNMIDAKLSRTKLLTINTGKKRLKEIDIIYWARAVGSNSLKQLGAHVKLPKLDISINSIAGFDIYNIRDCEIMAHFVAELNRLGITNHHMPGLAREKISSELVKQNFGTVYSSRNFGRFDSHGARCEAYFSNLSGLIEIDANSLYPSIMSQTIYPLLQKKKKDKTDYSIVSMREIRNHKELINAVDTFDFDESRDPRKTFKAWESHVGNVIYSAVIEITGCDDDKLEIFPFGLKTEEGSLHFRFVQNGIYEIFGYELMFLRFCTYNVKRLFKSQGALLPFSGYVENTYKERQELKKQGSELQQLKKIILNAGFGIWGARGDKRQAVTDMDTVNYFDSRTAEAAEALDVPQSRLRVVLRQTERGIFKSVEAVKKIGERYVSYDFDEPRYVKVSIPSIAIFTLSNSRAYMYLCMLAAGLDTIGYTDTDSLFLKRAGYDRLVALGVIGNEMAQLKVEIEEIGEGYAAGPKLYAFTDAKTGKYYDSHKGLSEFGDCEISRMSYHQPLSVSVRRFYDPETATKRTLINGKFMNLPAARKNKAFEAVMQKLQVFEKDNQEF